MSQVTHTQDLGLTVTYVTTIKDRKREIERSASLRRNLQYHINDETAKPGKTS